MKRTFKGGITATATMVALVAVLIVASLLVTGCSKKETGTAEAKAANALLKALGGDDAAAKEKAFAALSPAVLVELTGKSSSPGGDFSYDLVEPMSKEEMKSLISSGYSEDQVKEWAEESAEVGRYISIEKYSGPGDVVVIPATIEGYPVKSILPDAFTAGYDYEVSIRTWSNKEERYIYEKETHSVKGEPGCNAVASVVIPASVAVIGSSAFRNCENLSSVILPDSLKFINGGVFAGCKELYNLVIPESITEVEWNEYSDPGDSKQWPGTFEGCGKLPLATRQRLKDLGYTGWF
jgi:hypothetical protein